MHFFNPVPRMPLVEVIRGEKSSEEAVATAVAYAQTLGKTPIVVNDCPGFLVNRVLFPYFAGFLRLVKDGVDYERIDKVMEKWGWPMGPALLLDVIGLDTGVHADNVMAAAFPDRMGHEGQNAMEAMVAAGRLGQKSGKGFYAWKPEKKGPPSKQPDPEAKAIAYGPTGARTDLPDEEIVGRTMLPMLLECSRCLEDRIVAYPGRGGRRATLRPRLPAVPRRDLPLGRLDRRHGARRGGREAPRPGCSLRAHRAAPVAGRERPRLPRGVTP